MQAKINNYLATLAVLRSRAADRHRDAYTVAIGQLLALDLITEDQWREAIELPQVKVK